MTVPGTNRDPGILPRRLHCRGGAVVVAANDAAPTQRRIPMSRLTDTQLVILSSASRRKDRGVDLPANVTVEAIRKAVDRLIRAGLLEEVCANGSLLAWRRDAEAGPMALRITKQGLEAIHVDGEAEPAPTQTGGRSAPAHEAEAPTAEVIAPHKRISLQGRSPPARSITRPRQRPRLARRMKADRARNKLACWRC